MNDIEESRYAFATTPVQLEDSSGATIPLTDGFTQGVTAYVDESGYYSPSGLQAFVIPDSYLGGGGALEDVPKVLSLTNDEIGGNTFTMSNELTHYVRIHNRSYVNEIGSEQWFSVTYRESEEDEDTASIDTRRLLFIGANLILTDYDLFMVVDTSTRRILVRCTPDDYSYLFRRIVPYHDSIGGNIITAFFRKKGSGFGEVSDFHHMTKTGHISTGLMSDSGGTIIDAITCGEAGPFHIANLTEIEQDNGSQIHFGTNGSNEILLDRGDRPSYEIYPEAVLFKNRTCDRLFAFVFYKSFDPTESESFSLVFELDPMQHGGSVIPLVDLGNIENTIYDGNFQMYGGIDLWDSVTAHENGVIFNGYNTVDDRSVGSYKVLEVNENDEVTITLHTPDMHTDDGRMSRVGNFYPEPWAMAFTVTEGAT